ncbi:MAG: fused MFS/spermidine synthase [Elusimicrobia bacterium]|nr:fused MFS/spermidine synthase [Elusimicrobiota bacterium]
MARLPSPVKTLSAGQTRFVLASLLVTGAATLVLEIVGTRVISPYYGSSLYCWSALITVTLIALAAGYSLGGRWADKSPYLTLFARLLCLAGAAVATVPALRMVVLQSTTPLGIQWGALASALILIAPALVLLSALGPLSIKLTAEAMASVGKSAGDIYAVSTVGSVAGAVLAGFVLIPLLPLSQILLGLSTVLLLLGSLGYYLSRQGRPVAQLAAAAAAAVAFLGFTPRRVVETNVTVKESAYGQIKILDFNGKRYLLVNGTTQSMAPIDTMESESQYAQSMEWAALARPGAKRALVIGIGAGLLPGALERDYGLLTDAVDVDPEMVSAARTYFNYRPRGDIFIEDGRTFLEKTPRRYGAVFLDAFGAELPPYHLFTLESFSRMREVLEPGGVVAINLVTMLHGKGAAPWLSAYKTLRAVFPEVRAYQAAEAFDDLANVVFFCSDEPLGHEARGKARPFIKKNLEFMLDHELKPGVDALDLGVLLSDDHAPMEYLLASSAARWRRSLQDKIPTVLLY